MDYKKSTNDKVLKDKKPDHTLISFFGDDSYGWFPKGRDIIPFHKNYDAKSRQPTAKKDKKFSRACAEGQEVYQRRLGKEPATKFRPHDFLHPGWSDDSDEEAAEDRYDDLRPLPVSAEKLQDCSAEQALLWLYSVACTPTERPKMSPVKIDCAKRQLFSLSKSQNIKLQDAAQKKKKASSPSADDAQHDSSPAAADEAAAEAAPAEAADEEAADAAELVKPEAPSGEKKKRKYVRKAQTAKEQTPDAAAKARPIKRKRKEAADAKVDKEQPKKQRRKPVIAAATDPAVNDFDSHAVDTTQAPSDPMQEEDEDEAKSEADEPLSDMEADAEADAAAEAEAEAEAEAAAEADAEAGSDIEQETEGLKRRSTARRKGMGSYRGSGPRRLKADMPGVVNVVRDMAYEPGSFEWDGRAAEGAAVLSFRELLFSYSSFQREGDLGEAVTQALNSKGVRWVKIKAAKEPKERQQYGIPAAPGDDLGIEYRYTHFVSKLPASRQAFDEQLGQFYSEHNAILSPPSIKGNTLDCYTIFNAVAQKGGYEAVSDTRQWSGVAREWQQEMTGMEAARIKKAYLKLLLAFEQHISQDATVEVRKKRATGMKRAGPSGSVEPDDQPVVSKIKKRKHTADQVKPASNAAGKAQQDKAQRRPTAAAAEEDSEPEGSEVSYDSDPIAEPQASEPESDAEEDTKRLAAAANAIKLKKLHSEARRDSKVVKRKLQRQQDGEQGSRGSRQKEREELPELVPEEIDVFSELKKEPSQGDTPKGRRQSVDSRAMAAKPGRTEEQSLRAHQERRDRQRQQMLARTSSAEARSKDQGWQGRMDELLASEPKKEAFKPDPDAHRLIVLQFLENYPLPTKAVISNIMTRFGAIDYDSDIWMDRTKSLVYARFKFEEDARKAYDTLQRRAASLLNMSEGSVTNVALLVPHGNIKPKRLGAPFPGSGQISSAAMLAKPAAYIPPTNSNSTPAQPAYSLPNLPQPVDPRRAEPMDPRRGARSANPTAAAQIGPPSSQSGSAELAAALGSSQIGQYPGAVGGLASVLPAAQFGMPSDPRADPRADPRIDARAKSAFRPVAGFAGTGPSAAALYRPPPPPSRGGLPPAGGLPPPGGLPPFVGGYPSASHQWGPPMGGLPPPSHMSGLARPQGYPMQRPLHSPAQPQDPRSPSSAGPQDPRSSAANRPSSLVRPAAGPAPAAAPASAAAPPLQALSQGLRPDDASAINGLESVRHLGSPQAAAAVPAAAAEADDASAAPAVTDVLALLRNAGMQNPLAGLQATLGSLTAPAAVSTVDGDVVRNSAANNAETVGSGTADAQDAAPVLAGDDGGGSAPDISNNIMALLGQLASTQ